VFSWIKQSGSLGGESRVIPFSATVDKQNNSIVVGIFYQSAVFGTTVFTSSGGYDSFVNKIDTQGNFIWSKQLSSSADYISSLGVSTDNSGNIYIVGNFKGSVSFGSIVLTEENNSQTSFIAKMDSSGNYIWAKKILNSNIGCIKADSQGNIIVFGKFSGQIVLDNFSLSGFDDYYVSKLDSNGNAIWLKGIQNPGYNFSYKSAITIDVSDNIYIASSYREVLYFDSIQINSSNPSNDDVFICKMSNDGNFLWAKGAGGVSSDLAQGIGVDEIGNIYIGSFI